MADWEKKQVVLVIEGTAALRPYWRTILNDSLNNLIRSFCDNGSSSEDDAAYNPNVEFAFVVFNTCGSFWLLHQSNWTNDVNCVMKWLSTIDFSSDPAFSETATAQGLAQALSMFRSSNESQNESLQRHCILVAASNPDPPPADVESVAKLFTQSNVSLSVLCPQQAPKLGAICNADKHNPSDTCVETSSEKSNIRRTLADVNYVKLWKGDLYGVIQGERLLLARLQAYLHLSASKIVKDWPSSFEIDFFSGNNIESLQKKYAETSSFVLFRAMHSHEVLRKLQKHDYGVIKLPPQIVVFTITKDPRRFIGMVFTEPATIYKKWKGQA